MSLDFYLEYPPCTACGRDTSSAFDRNITHNLGKMFSEARVYEILWHGDGQIAGDVVSALSVALDDMQERPDFFRTFDAPHAVSNLL